MRGDAGFVNGTQVDRARAWAGLAPERAARAGVESAGLEPQPVRVRPASDGDGEALREFVGGLSLRTRYLRFFAGVPRVTPAMLRRMTGTRLPGGDLVDALVVTEAEAIIGHGMATDTRDSAGTAVTEIGVVVADGWQGHGVGSALTRALAARAQARGATALMMDVLAENHKMLALISKYLPTARCWQAGPYVTVHVPLPLTQEEQPRESAVRPHKAHDAHDAHRQRQHERDELKRGWAPRAAAHLSVG
jgi:GNAT superfamily N-acetyltransferase